MGSPPKIGDKRTRPVRHTSRRIGASFNGISVNMDSKSAWRDNVFVERFWRTIKREEVLSARL
jgi:hypothetical protein